MWMQEAAADVERRGTKGKCSEGGAKGTFGSKECPPGSKQYNLAVQFKKAARGRRAGGARGTVLG